MNRILQIDENPEHELTGNSWTTSVRTAVGTTHEPRPHEIFIPLSYEQKHAYPLIVWLHGGGSDERQLSQVMRQISLRNYAGVSPRGFVSAKSSAEHGQQVCYWLEHEDAVADAADRVQECLQIVRRRLHIDDSRVYLAGYADGGTLALRMALRFPEMFAGVASVHGRFPRGGRPLQAFPRTRRLRILWQFGNESTFCGPEQVAEDMPLLHATGAAVHLRQYQTDNDPVDIMFQDLNRWIMESLNAAPTSRTNASLINRN